MSLSLYIYIYIYIYIYVFICIMSSRPHPGRAARRHHAGQRRRSPGGRLIMDFPLEGISLYDGFPFIRDFPL